MSNIKKGSKLTVSTSNGISRASSNNLGVLEVSGPGLANVVSQDSTFSLSSSNVPQFTIGATDNSGIFQLGLDNQGNAVLESTLNGSNKNILIQQLGGNVGIGTTNPITILNIAGTSVNPSNDTFSSTTSKGILRLNGTGGVFMDVGFQASAPKAGWIQTHDGTISGTGDDLLLQPIRGNVGIGTTDPSGGKLHVVGDIYTTGKILGEVGGSSLIVGGTTYQNGNAPTNGMLVEGNVGIGTTSPDVKLHINDTGAIKIPKGTTNQRPSTSSEAQQGYIRYNSTTNTFEGYGAGNTWGSLGGIKDVDGDTYIRAETSPNANNNSLDFFTADSQQMTIDSSGNVGIGTTSPGTPLTIVGDPDTLELQRSGITGKVIFQTPYSGNDVGLAIKTGGSTPTEKFRITPAGNVGIGTNDPDYKLHVNGNINCGGVFTINGSKLIRIADSTDYGGIKVGYGENGKNYPVELSSGKAYVNVPWTDNNTTYSVGNGGLTEYNFTNALLTKLNGIATNANNFTYSLPTARSFTSLTNGNLTINSSSFTLSSGDAYFNQGGGGATYIGNTNNDTIINTSKVYIKGTTGKVGIGTSSPKTILEVSCGSFSGASENSPSIAGQNPYANVSAAFTRTNTNNNNHFGLVIGHLADTGRSYLQTMSINNASTYDLLLQPSGGKVGIGTTNPVSILTVVGVPTPTLRLVYNGGSYTSGNVYMALDQWSINTKSNALAIQNDAGNTNDIRMCQGGGKVGINTSAMGARLHVHLGVPASFTGYYSYRAEGPSATDFAATDLACYFRGHVAIYSGRLLVTSDRRIKKNIEEVPDNLSLGMLRNIPIQYYDYMDQLSNGFGKQIGFIAQEVKDHFPIAVKIRKEIVPDKMCVLNNISWTEITKNNKKQYKLISDLQDVSGIKYRFYVGNDLSENNEKDIIGNSDDSFTFDQSWNNVFCYGKEVDDFHMLDKNKLWALNFSASQEIDRLQQQEITKVQILQTDLSTANTTIQSHETTIQSHETTIQSHETTIQSYETTIQSHETTIQQQATKITTLETQIADILSRLSVLENSN